MNTVTIPRLFKQSALLLSLIGFSLLLAACGGSDKKNTASLSSLSSSSAHIFVPTPVHPAGSGTWPAVNVSANHSKTLIFKWTDSSIPVDTTYYKLFKKADKTDNNSSFVQVGLNLHGTVDPVSHMISVTDTVSVHLTDWLNSLYKIQACSDSAACVDSDDIIIDSAMLSAITYIKASNAEADDWFGWSIAISGDGKTLAVGAPAEDSKSNVINGDKANNDSPNSGAVYVFVKDESGNWQEQAYLKASNTEQPNIEPNLTLLPNDRFGYQVALSADGNTLAVSAILEDSLSIGINCNDGDLEYTTTSLSSSSTVSILVHQTTDIGAIYMFKRTDNVWAPPTYIKSFKNFVNLHFGSILALSGDGKRLAVGIPGNSVFGSGISGPSSVSSECFNFNASPSSTSSVSSSSSKSSSSTSSSSLPGGVNSGAIYLYKIDDLGNWSEDAFIKAPDATAASNFGASVALSFDGSTLAVGADGENLDSNSSQATFIANTLSFPVYAGATYVYTSTDNQWSFQQKLKASRNLLHQQFGISVAISGDGNTIAAAATGDFNVNGGVNPIADETTLNNLRVEALLGTLLVADENKLQIDSGAVFIFARSNNLWSQEAYLKSQYPQDSYSFGNSMALSFTGDVLAVGSFLESSLATGIGGDIVDKSSQSSGAAFLFKRTTGNWLQKSYIKAPNTAANDRFGHALGLDDTGDTLVIGAHRESSKATGINGDQTNDPDNPNDINKTNKASGAVYIY